MRDALRRVLRVRGLTLSATLEHRVEACEDPEVLSQWLDRAEVVDRTADLFVDER